MSSVLDRPALEKSPLADLHLLANELGVENFRRLRKADLIDALLDRQSGADTGDRRHRTPPPRPRRRGRRRGPRGRRREGRSRRGRRGGRCRARAPRRGRRDDDAATRRAASRGRRARPRRATATATATATRRRRGQGRRGRRRAARQRLGLRPARPPEPTDDDVYVSAAQVKRCELVSGDRVGGPVRAPRRSERFPSLVRVDTINGRPADEVAEGTRFEDLPAAFPAERFELGSDDPTVKAIEWLTPFGKGSRVVIAGGARAGKSEALRRIAAALAGRDGLELSVVLAGVRPEEAAEWADGPAARPRPSPSPPRPTRRPRPSSRRSSRAAASRPAAATPSCSPTRSSTSAPAPPAARSPRPATSPAAAR